MFRKVVFLLAVLLLPIPHVAKPVDQGEFRCDGGWCEDGKEHVLDCSKGFCTGDAIPSHFPTLLPSYSTGSWLLPSSMVLGLVLNNNSFAFPLSILNFYETVSDVLLNLPVLITYCPLCGSGIVFDRRIANQTLTLYNSGEIWQQDLVLYDVSTESRWSQVAAKGLTGEMYGKRLKVIDSVIMEWRFWQDLHPTSKVMNRPVDEQGNLLYNFSNDHYDRSRLVHGVKIKDQAVAFPLEVLFNKKSLNLKVQGVSIVVIFAAGDGYVYRSDGSQFSVSNTTVISNGSSSFNVFTGNEINGNDTLDLIPGQTMYEFAWKTFHPDTLIYTDEGFTSDTGGTIQIFPLVIIALSISVLIIFLVQRIYPKIRSLK